LPLLPALAFFLIAAVAAGQARRWRERLRLASLDARAGLCLIGVAALALLLFPSLVHFDEKNLRRAIEQTHAPLVLRQPEWRDYVLRETRRKIDDLGLLESEPQGPHPPEIEELAYAVWSATDLASFGFTSAIEIQDAQGYIVSRFALNLPSISGATRSMPKSTDWALQRERATVGSAERPVVHASRLLAYEGRVRGAVHVFVGDDFWNLPFLESRDPYSALFRRGLDTQQHTRPLGLLVYDQALRNLFSSDERPPLLEPALLERVRAAPRGFWTTLGVGARRQHALLVADAGALYAITYSRTDAPRYLADLIEAVLSLTLLALLSLLLLMLLRTLLGRRELSLSSAFAAISQRFALRLFVAFMLVAIVPVLVLQKVVERFVTDRLRGEGASQALELAAVAKKAVEDYALFQRDEAPGQQPVSDAALVWVASLIQNDLDVFERGRLLASSKRELYASGLLPQRLSGEVFRALELDGESSSLRNESIGGFSYQVVSVPLLFEGGGRGVLQIPLALRQREVEAVVEDLLRTIRLTSLVFLAAAAGLAVSMSRRISGPLHALIAATHRVAAGDFAARVRPRTRDELHTLVDSFNRMAQDLEQQRTDLERTNKLAAWADMARQVAHEVKNPLTPIQLATEHLRRVYADKSADFGRTLQSCTDTILQQVQTLREIVTEFSSFARPPAPTPERLELQPLLTQVARAYQDVLPRQVTLELLPGAAPVVAADRRLVERAVVNLVENALQAVGDQGTVRLRVLEDGHGRAVVEVEDTGPGLDPEAKARIFEPFFSTKASGSGLGLALVKKIAEDHGGGVSIDSPPGEATRARLWFPPAP
jgi:signal transduction histidine kinase